MARALVGLLFCIFPALALADDVAKGYTQGPGGYYRVEDRSGPYSISPDGTAVLSGLPMPFMRSGDPFTLPATVTAQSYVITQPAGTRSYRGVNPCPNVNVRVKTVTATLPMVTEPATYLGKPIPNVQRVTSPTGSVYSMTGTLVQRGLTETLGSSVNPMAGSQRVISVMLVPVPGSTADISGVVCPYELGYGNGG